ncbi:MAG TPA: ethanolamine ammonia-lyase subunit EutC [Roseiflexaceae bacterium]|nr:ethanolamine ammonia-lyase subunit EutC [Roseiflexaceae bacterium]
MNDELITPNPWQGLRRFTGARLALGRVGNGLPTAAHLEFQLAHARARDAVHLPFDDAALAAELAAQGETPLLVQSAAPDRASYLRRPDLGRRLDGDGRALLAQHAAPEHAPYDAAFVIADGLSALAVHRHATALLLLAAALLRGAGWRLAPVVLARQGRVALGDEIGELLRAEQVAVLIGERPGLSAADSLGVYLTYAPRPGRTDAERNCISNIRPEGLDYNAACQTLVYLMSQARRLRLTGVQLKDDRASADAAALDSAS